MIAVGGQLSGDQNLLPEPTSTAGNIPPQYIPSPQFQPCPCCGRCPVCGRGGYPAVPVFMQPYSIPVYGSQQEGNLHVGTSNIGSLC